MSIIIDKYISSGPNSFPMILQAQLLSNILHQMNPWWGSGSVPGSMLGVPRPIAVGQVMDVLRRKRVALVTGPRRSGKTTILYQCVEGLIGSGVGADRVLFAMLDHPLLCGKDAIGDVVEWFMAEFKHSRGTPLYVLLDEAHLAQGWGAWAKTLHDVYRFPLVISGSSAMELEAGSMEGLTGRHEAVRVRPLGLREYMEFRSLTPARGDAHMMPRIADDYLIAGGFPEAVLSPDDHARRSLLLHLFGDTLLGDIVGVRSIRDVATLRDIATMVFSSTGTHLSFRKIARAVGCSVDTAEDYVGHMVACHLVSAAPFHSRSAKERTRNPSKYYPVDTGMLDALLGGASKGILAETSVFNELSSAYQGRGRTVGHWRDVKEVDFVVGARPTALYEVKYRDEVDVSTLGGVRRFIDRRGQASVTVVTRSLSGTVDLGGTEATLVPLWRFLLGAPGPA